jgi:hypothetical protein
MNMKSIIVDKNIIHLESATTDGLTKLAARCQLVLPHALWEECTISSSNEPRELVGKLMEAVKGGAYAGKSPAQLYAEEQDGVAVSSILDLQETELIRQSVINPEVDIEKVAAQCRKAFEPTVALVSNMAQVFYANACKRGIDRCIARETEGSDICQRLHAWLDAVDQMRTEIVQHLMGTNKGLGQANSWSWQWVRLSMAWEMELMAMRARSGPSFDRRDCSNDAYDIHYVALLCRADAIITRDGTLVAPLARAGFGNVEVFANITQALEAC